MEANVIAPMLRSCSNGNLSLIVPSPIMVYESGALKLKLKEVQPLQQEPQESEELKCL